MACHDHTIHFIEFYEVWVVEIEITEYFISFIILNPQLIQFSKRFVRLTQELLITHKEPVDPYHKYKS